MSPKYVIAVACVAVDVRVPIPGNDQTLPVKTEGINSEVFAPPIISDAKNVAVAL